jgi:hypothetical protein
VDAGVAVDYTGFAIGWPTPMLGRSPRSEWEVAAEHLTERCRQFFIIALGELILITVVTLGGDGFTADHTAAFAVSITTTVLFWRIYLSPTGELLTEAIEVSADRLRPALSATLAHLIMVAGIVATAVGAQRVIAHPHRHTPPGWIAVILGGPASKPRSWADPASFCDISPRRAARDREGSRAARHARRRRQASMMRPSPAAMNAMLLPASARGSEPPSATATPACVSLLDGQGG